MSREVRISENAEEKLKDLLNYLIENWSEKVQSNFIKKLDSSINFIRSNPLMFTEIKKNTKIHRCVVTKQTTLFYKFDAKAIYIIAFFDTRQHPLKLRKSLK
ncbi:plasmid stabilization system protein ParE [Kordia periserrulae]|uniref:Plasmid stabilization system protein ParE n=1 Tax=Kordia periserrulae TaxID=701523 RepID=A0A2T6BVU1_9FLAO|nr:type II toxin-antitoxin system RelE/ParE family toxin [Kordia periserrulae]PTX60097.1 plasmid stabilization system protein ParE [Kordia periserrulae]